MNDEGIIDLFTWSTPRSNPCIFHDLASFKEYLTRSGREIVSESDLEDGDEGHVKIVFKCQRPSYEFGTIMVRNGVVVAFTDPVSQKPIPDATLYPFIKELITSGWQPVGEWPPYETEGQYEIRVNRPKAVNNR